MFPLPKIFQAWSFNILAIIKGCKRTQTPKYHVKLIFYLKQTTHTWYYVTMKLVLVLFSSRTSTQFKYF